MYAAQIMSEQATQGSHGSSSCDKESLIDCTTQVLLLLEELLPNQTLNVVDDSLANWLDERRKSAGMNSLPIVRYGLFEFLQREDQGVYTKPVERRRWLRVEQRTSCHVSLQCPEPAR